MGIGSEFRKVGRKWEDYTKKNAKYTLAVAGGIVGGPAGAKAGYDLGSTFDPRHNNETGTDLGKLRSEATANGFNPLTVLRATGGQGFYNNQVPMGRLSSQSFFNAFDAYDNYKNKNAPVIEEPEIEIDPKNYFNGGVKISPFKINETPVIQSPLRFDVVNIDGFHTSSDNKALYSQWTRPGGDVVTIPGESTDLSEMLGATLVDRYYEFKKLFPKLSIKNLRNILRNSGKKSAQKESDLLLKLQEQMRYKEGAISQKALGTLRNISAEDKKFVDYMKSQF